MVSKKLCENLWHGIYDNTTVDDERLEKNIKTKLNGFVFFLRADFARNSYVPLARLTRHTGKDQRPVVTYFLIKESIY